MHTTATARVRRCGRGAATAVTERLCQRCRLDGGDGEMPGQPAGHKARQRFQLGVGGLTVALAPIAHRRMRHPDGVGDVAHRHAGASRRRWGPRRLDARDAVRAVIAKDDGRVRPRWRTLTKSTR